MSPPWIAAFLALCGCVAVLALLVVGLLRRLGPVLDRAEAAITQPHPMDPDQGASVGERVDEFTVVGPGGERVASNALWDRGPVLVLLLSSGCGPCRTVAQEIATEGWQGPLPLIPLLPDGDGELDLGGNVVAFRQEVGLSASAAFRSAITPHAFVVDLDGTVLARGVGNSIDSLTRLAAVSRAAVEAGEMWSK